MRDFWNAAAWDELIEWIYMDFEIAKIIMDLIDHLRQRGKLKATKPLIRDLRGWWEIDIVQSPTLGSHVLVYRFKDGNLQIVSCSGHYPSNALF
jgi:Txe/YoeB family toxin of Txe-Axe toxin-antitoxin module